MASTEWCSGCNRPIQVAPQLLSVRCAVCQTVTRVQPYDNTVVRGRQSPAWLYSINSGVGSGYAYPGTYGNANENGYGYYPDGPRPRPRPQLQPQLQRPPTLPRPSAFGRKRALLCGLSYYGTTYTLSGSVNDVKRMRFLLIENLGFPSDCVLVLSEEESNPRRIPTKQNMRAALRWLVQDCQAGDTLVFHYSGHGSQQKDFNRDELDGIDEAICPVDYETEGPIIDDELNATIVRPLPQGAKLHAIVDTSYSGTVLDLPFVCKMNREGYYAWEDQRNRRTYKGTSGGLAICLSGCDDHQMSASTMNFTNREVTGAMTTSFIHVVQNEPGLTYGHLLGAMRIAIPSLIKDTNVSQTPQLSSSQKFDIHSMQFIL